MIFPHLQAGDQVAIIAPASRCSDVVLSNLIELLKSWDLNPSISEPIFGDDLLCANSDPVRFEQAGARCPCHRTGSGSRHACRHRGDHRLAAVPHSAGRYIAKLCLAEPHGAAAIGPQPPPVRRHHRRRGDRAPRVVAQAASEGARRPGSFGRHHRGDGVGRCHRLTGGANLPDG